VEKRTDLIRQASRVLDREGVPCALTDAEVLLSHVLDCARVELYLDNNRVAEDQRLYFHKLLKARSERFPLQYLVGSTEFMGLALKVKPGVFIPRPETEILVETILNLPAANCPLPAKILDIGTGSGNIAISLAKYLKEKSHIFACDISDSALQLARENCKLNKADIYLVKSNLFSAFKNTKYFSIIVSNPPYIRKQLIALLPEELSYEPKEAYDGGGDGLLYCRQIINQAPCYLKKRGLLCLEIGDQQAGAVKEIIAQSSELSFLKIVSDFNGIERVIVARKDR
jgi:release factor glutamine methyltransferase